jgi:O-antigen/teichoic acid export membrane protein
LSLWRRVLYFGGLNAGYGALSAAVTLVTAGLLYRALGVEYGLLALVTGGMLRLNLVDDSLGAYVVKSLAERHRVPGAAARVAVAVRLYLLLAAAFALVFAVALAVLLRERPEVWALAAAGGGGLLLATLGSLAARVLEGREAYATLRLHQSFVLVLRLAVLAVLFRGGADSLLLYVLVFAAGYGLLWGVLLVSLRRSGFRWPLRAPGWREELRPLARFLRPLLVAKSASVVSYRLDLWIVQVFAGTAATAAYAMAEALAGFAAQALEILKALLPVSVRDWRDDPAWVRRLVVTSTQLSAFVGAGLCAVALAAAEPLLAVWFGEAPPLAVLASRLLLVFYALTSFRSAAQTLLLGQGAFDRLERPFLTAAVLNLTISVTATALLGPWGAALGTLLSGVYLLFANLRQAEEAFGLGRHELLRGVAAPGSVVLAVAVLAAHWGGEALAATSGGPGPVAELLLRATLAGALFAALFWFGVLDREERSRMLGAVLRRSP